MNSTYRAYLVTILLIGFVSERTQAQFSPSKYEAGINIGSMIYQGDLSEGAFGYMKTLRPAVGLYAARALDDFFSVRANLDFGSILGDDRAYSSPTYRRFRALSFSSSVTEVSGTFVWHIMGNTYSGRSRFSPYLFAGLGASFLSVKRDWKNMDLAYFGLQSEAVKGLGIDTMHRTPGVIPVFPVGLGVQYSLTPQLSLTSELTYRFTGTDYLDGFSQVADPKKKDAYYSFTIGIAYRFGTNRMDCPKVPK